jgi:hypothetical protein
LALVVVEVVVEALLYLIQLHLQVVAVVDQDHQMDTV